MNLPRSCGVLLHPTSLPGPYGIGDFGPEAIRFLDFLSAGGQNLWQMLPLNPPSSSQSPYQCYSAFAGNPLLISPNRLVEKKLLLGRDLSKIRKLPADKVDFVRAHRLKLSLLRQAHKQAQPDPDYDTFCEKEAFWLEDYALFMALKDRYRGAPWPKWKPDLAKFRPKALGRARRELTSEIGFYKFVQYLFFQEHGLLKHEANKRGIRIIGDLPIFVAHNSSDVWSHQNLFKLKRSGEPAVVAGVPPDYFSKTGQRWGNPLYRWEVMERDNYGWWLDRLRMAHALCDIVRIDH